MNSKLIHTEAEEEITTGEDSKKVKILIEETTGEEISTEDTI
jgi:hypothetical protein